MCHMEALYKGPSVVRFLVLEKKLSKYHSISTEENLLKALASKQSNLEVTDKGRSKLTLRLPD